MNTFESACRAYRARAEPALAARLPGAGADSDSGSDIAPNAAPSAALAPAQLANAMRYACLNGGKRFRAMLVYAGGAIAGAESAALDAPAAAVEMIHAYSLIHDDLPAMDDDDLRRGRPACHIAFGEAAAILAGDALQALAFEVLSADPALRVSAGRRLRMVETLAVAVGARGMAGGQALDMQAGGGDFPDNSTVDDSAVAPATVADSAPNTVAHLARIHRLKTGALIRASAQLGALAAEDAGDELLQRIDDYAAHLGLAFQITDDILDAEAAPDGGALGKRGGADKRMQKATYAALLGVEKARIEARESGERAVAAAAGLREIAAGFGDNAAHADFLAHLARFAVNRNF
ncbi:MAG: polyprenyl synthetase family protein [Gammaproteobacteria bacterium]|nr:polyprenyl synthetase family protein [Gammaproteobacteria bacterium]